MSHVVTILALGWQPSNQVQLRDLLLAAEGMVARTVGFGVRAGRVEAQLREVGSQAQALAGALTGAPGVGEDGPAGRASEVGREERLVANGGKGRLEGGGRGGRLRVADSHRGRCESATGVGEGE